MNDTTLKISQIPKVYDEEDAKYAQKFYLDTYSTIDQIIPRLYLSNDCIARNRKILNDHKITHILNLTTTFQNAFDNKFIYKTIRINDNLNESIYKHFNDSFEFIDNAINTNGRVLVHCNMGVSRSPSFIIAYLLQKRVFNSYIEAYEHVAKCRVVIYPNLNFVKQLVQLEKMLKLN